CHQRRPRAIVVYHDPDCLDAVQHRVTHRDGKFDCERLRHPGVASIEAQENSTRQRPDMLKMDRFFVPGMHCGSDRGLRFCRAIRDQPPDARTVSSEYDLRKDITAPQRIVQTLSLTVPQ